VSVAAARPDRDRTFGSRVIYERYRRACDDSLRESARRALPRPGLPRSLHRRVRQSSMSRTSFGVAGRALSRWSVRIALTSTLVPATAISFA
jgi:hypothetical protein